MLMDGQRMPRKIRKWVALRVWSVMKSGEKEDRNRADRPRSARGTERARVGWFGNDSEAERCQLQSWTARHGLSFRQHPLTKRWDRVERTTGQTGKVGPNSRCAHTSKRQRQPDMYERR